MRLWSGLILFSFALLHFINHALGIVSIEWMDAFQSVRRGFWRSPPGTILLFGAALIHAGLGLWKIAQRRSLKMPIWEALQIGLVLLIPYQLVAHTIATRAMNERFGVRRHLCPRTDDPVARRGLEPVHSAVGCLGARYDRHPLLAAHAPLVS